MANQISKIESKQSVFQSKTSHLCFRIFIIGLLILSLSISLVQTATCSNSVPSSAATTTEKYTFELTLAALQKNLFNLVFCSLNGYSFTYTVGIVGCPASNSLYYLYRLQLVDNKPCFNVSKNMCLEV